MRNIKKHLKILAYGVNQVIYEKVSLHLQYMIKIADSIVRQPFLKNYMSRAFTIKTATDKRIDRICTA